MVFALEQPGAVYAGNVIYAENEQFCRLGVCLVCLLTGGSALYKPRWHNEKKLIANVLEKLSRSLA